MVDVYTAKALSRRQFLKMVGLATGGIALASCAPVSTTVPEEKPTQAAADPPEAPTKAADPAPTNTVEAPTQVPTPELMEAVEFAPIAATKKNGWVTKLVPVPFKFDPPMHISMNYMYNSAIQYAEGETLEDNWWTRWQKEKMGLVYDVKWSGAWYTDATKQSWSTTMASEDFPEMLIIPDRQNYHRLVSAGKLEDITGIWEQVASPLTKKKKNWPDGNEWIPFRNPEKRMYTIYSINTEEAGLDVLAWVRKDWMDKIGATQPKTVDDIYQLAKAFKDKGLATIGFPLSNNITPWIGTVDPIFGAFGTMPFIWNKASDNTLVYGSIEPKVKDVLALLNKWFKDGIIDPEFATKNEDNVIADMTSGKAGLTFAPYWAYGWPFPDTKASDPNADFVYFDLPAAPDGKRGRRGMNPFEGTPVSFLKGTDPKKIEAVIKQLNWAYDRRENWAEKADYHNTYGPMVEGYEYHWEGDEVKIGPKEVCAIWCYSGSYTGNPATYTYPGMFMDLITEVDKIAKKDPAAMNAFEKFYTSDKITAYQREAYKQTYNTRDQQMLDQYVGDPTDKMVDYYDQLHKMELQTFVEIINGTRPVDSFDTFVKDWKSQGGDEMTADVNAWYKSTNV